MGDIDQQKTYIIAEIGVNHNGCLDTALRLIDVAANCGADAVKFQTFNADDLVLKNTEAAEYQKASGTLDQYTLLKSLELPASYYPELIKRCKSQNIEFLSTPFNIESAKWLVDMGMKKIKIASGEITHLPFLRQLARLNLPIILSTGMSTLDEVVQAVNVLQQDSLAPIISILHCTSNYPALDKDIHLHAIKTMQDALNLPIGYSDHTEGILIAPIAVGLGANVIEKHFTLDRNAPGPDHQASITPHDLKILVEHIRRVERSMGSTTKAPTQAELPVRALVRRSIALARDKRAGDKLAVDDLICIRPAKGICPTLMHQVVGKALKSDKVRQSVIHWQDLI